VIPRENDHSTHARPVVGVLALQGCVEPHQPHLEAAGAQMKRLLGPADLAGVDALLLPGGESSAMLELIAHTGLLGPLRDAATGLPTWGVCAGAILLAREVRDPAQQSLGVLDMVVARNAYGRQLASARGIVDGCPVLFIRAPRVLSVGDGVSVLDRRGEDATWVEQGDVFATTFHPELSRAWPSPFHRRLLAAVARRRRSSPGDAGRGAHPS
jgi:pyridoxal 5'-phosphate synthase pdxT subunit